MKKKIFSSFKGRSIIQNYVRPESALLNFLTTSIKHLHFMTTFLNFTLKNKPVELQGY